jgi:T-complex protein 1 subunit delta
VIAGALLNCCTQLMDKGIHPTAISKGFGIALTKSLEILNSISIPIDLSNKEYLIECVKTALSSKVVSGNSNELAPIAVDAVLKICNPETDHNVDLNDIKIVKKLGGTIEEVELVEGIVFGHAKASSSAGGPSRIEKPKIALVQFCLSAPKTDLDSNIVIGDYSKIDKVLKQEKTYIIELVKKIVKSGANVLLIQKSVLREAVSDLALHFLAKKNIMVVKNIERNDVEFICKVRRFRDCLTSIDYWLHPSCPHRST